MPKIKNLKKLLSLEDTNKSIIELDNAIGELCHYGENMKTLTEPQKQFYYNQCLEREVNNGGFNQYFINTSGNFAHQTVVSLRTIGANTTADILQKAIDQFPGQKVPKVRKKRIEIVEQIEGSANKVWGKLNKKFFEYQDDLNTLNINFVKLHKADF